VDGSRYYLFAGPGLAQQQNGPTAASQFVHHSQNVANARRLADQNMVRYFTVTNHFVAWRFSLRGL
jgi:hypothetical protein